MMIVLLLIIVVIFMAIYIIFADEIKTVKERDPAAKSALEVLLLYPGLHALVVYRISHQLWEWKIPFVPRWLSQSSAFFDGDRNPSGGRRSARVFLLTMGWAL